MEKGFVIGHVDEEGRGIEAASRVGVRFFRLSYLKLFTELNKFSSFLF